MELQDGDRVINIYNNSVKIKPGMRGTATGRREYPGGTDKERWWQIEWNNFNWWVPESWIKRIKP